MITDPASEVREDVISCGTPGHGPRRLGAIALTGDSSVIASSHAAPAERHGQISGASRVACTPLPAGPPRTTR